jgi:hypothetical protein
MKFKIFIFIYFFMFLLLESLTNTSADKSKFKKKTVTWNQYKNDIEYSDTMVRNDFGNIYGWNSKRATIVDSFLRITLAPNALSAASGIVSSVNIKEGDFYQLKYDIRFDKDFDWGRGGKVGFGFQVGETRAGGVSGDDGQGGTFRLAWYKDNDERVYFRPYLYHKDQNGKYGSDFGLTYPTQGSLIKNKTYKIVMKIKNNSSGKKNGRAIITIDGDKFVDITIRWTDCEDKKKIHRLLFHTFRGGNQKHWMSSKESFVYYDNFELKRLRK